MILIGPTDGRAGAAARVSPADSLILGAALQNRLRYKLDTFYRDKYGAPVPEGWVSSSRVDLYEEGMVEYRAEVRPPEKSRVAYLPELKETRTFQMYLSPTSKIPLVRWPYEFDRTHIKPADHLTFQGWDLETGLMVFDR